MKVLIFTIRSKEDNSLIFAEGAPDPYYRSHFQLAEKWFTEEDWVERGEGWTNYTQEGFYSFDEAVVCLTEDNLDLVKFALEEIEYQ